MSLRRVKAAVRSQHRFAHTEPAESYRHGPDGIDWAHPERSYSVWSTDSAAAAELGCGDTPAEAWVNALVNLLIDASA